MKPASDFLWRLIQSLSSREKLFFKRNFASSATHNDKVYLKLFDAIAKQKKYDEAGILKKFAPQLNKKNIAFQKHYLQRQIGEAIIHYDSRGSATHTIYEQLLLIRLYRKKGMPDEAHAIWKKAVMNARKLESFALLGLLKTEFEKIILFSNIHTRYDELHAIFKGNIISYTEYTEMIMLRDIYTETLLLKRRSHFDFDENLRIKMQALLERVNESDTALYGRSFWFRHYYRMNKATLLYLLGETLEALELLKQEWQDWKKHPEFISTDAEFYIELMYMINYAGILRGEFRFVEDAFHDPLAELISEPNLRANFEVIKYLALNKIYNKMARYDEVGKLVSFMKSKYSQWESVLNSDLNRTTNLSLGIGSFVLEKYDDALYFIKRGIGYFRDGAREEHTASGYMLLLLITFSMDRFQRGSKAYAGTPAGRHQTVDRGNTLCKFLSL